MIPTIGRKFDFCIFVWFVQYNICSSHDFCLFVYLSVFILKIMKFFEFVNTCFALSIQFYLLYFLLECFCLMINNILNQLKKKRYFCISFSVSRQQYRSNWSSYTPSHLDSTLVSNMHKLFSERIEIFSTVEFNKVSILTGIIKISLKVNKICLKLIVIL